jgi:hypothetical protein
VVSSQQEIPGTEPAGVEGAGEVSGTPEGAAESTSTLEVGSTEGTPEAAPEPYDQDAVISAGGEQALKQYKDLQRNFSRQQAKLKSFEALDPIEQQLGGGTGILNVLRRFDRLLSNPAMEKAILHFEQSGSLPTEARGYEEMDEEKDPRDEKIEFLESRLARIEGRVTERGVSAHLDRLKQEFPDDINDLIPALEEKLRDLRGSASGQEILNNLNYDTLYNMAVVSLYGDPQKRAQRAARDHSKLLALKKARTTDSPTVGATTGRESPGEAKSHVLEAFEDFKRREGISGPILYDR